MSFNVVDDPLTAILIIIRKFIHSNMANTNDWPRLQPLKYTSIQPKKNLIDRIWKNERRPNNGWHASVKDHLPFWYSANWNNWIRQTTKTSSSSSSNVWWSLYWDNLISNIWSPRRPMRRLTIGWYYRNRVAYYSTGNRRIDQLY